MLEMSVTVMTICANAHTYPFPKRTAVGAHQPDASTGVLHEPAETDYTYDASSGGSSCFNS